MTIQGAYKEIQGWELPSYAEPSRRKVLETIAKYFDAVPVVHGKWIYHVNDLFPAESTQECSLCHSHEYATIQNDNFCPNCGARMDGE